MHVFVPLVSLAPHVSLVTGGGPLPTSIAPGGGVKWLLLFTILIIKLYLADIK